MKTKFTQEQLDEISKLFHQDIGSRKIAKILGVNRSTIIRAYRQLGLESFNKKTPRYAYKITEKICKLCSINKSIEFFRKRTKGDRVSYETYCLDCEKIYSRKSNKIRYRKKWNEGKAYRDRNKDRIKKYLKTYLPVYRKNRMNADPAFKIRCQVSTAIYVGLKKDNNYKGGGCWKFLSYSPTELKNNLETQFESWMSWNNHGKYNPIIWDDDDQTTWTWQIDHIIPQSDLPYTSMEDENFKKCWSLSNLRPLSSKQNLLDGVNRTRHIK